MCRLLLPPLQALLASTRARLQREQASSSGTRGRIAELESSLRQATADYRLLAQELDALRQAPRPGKQQGQQQPYAGELAALQPQVQGKQQGVNTAGQQREQQSQGGVEHEGQAASEALHLQVRELERQVRGAYQELADRQQAIDLLKQANILLVAELGSWAAAACGSAHAPRRSVTQPGGLQQDRLGEPRVQPQCDPARTEGGAAGGAGAPAGTPVRGTALRPP